MRGTPAWFPAHPHGSPQMSHVIPLHVIQTLKSDRCNSNVFSAHQKLTERNYVRLFGACEFSGRNGCPCRRGRNSSGGCTHSRGPGTPGHNTPVTPVGAPGNRTPSTHASGQPGVNDRTSDQASHVDR